MRDELTQNYPSLRDNIYKNGPSLREKPIHLYENFYRHGYF